MEVRYAYDASGGATITNAAGSSSTVFRNEYGQPAIIEDALARMTRFIYDSNRNLIRVVGPDGSEITNTFDKVGNLVRIEDALGQRIDFGYELSFNRLLSLRDPFGQTTLFGYDTRGNATSLVYPDGSTDQFRYDETGNITQVINGRGQSIVLIYNAQNLLVRKEFADGSGVDYAYDGHRNLTSLTDATGTTTFTYDTANRVTGVTYPNGRSLQFTYDAAGRRTRSVDNSGFTVNYAYDSIGRVAGLTDGANQQIVTYTRDTVGRLTREDRGNGTFSLYTYTPTGDIDIIAHHAPDNTVLGSLDYDYDALRRVVSVTTLDGTTTYGYDGAGQLTSVALPGGRTITYAYDAAGNRISVTDNGVISDYTANNMNQYTAVGGSTFAYDADGNLVSRTDATGTATFAYDAEGRLISVDTPTDDLSYQYDALGNRVAVEHNGLRTEYLIDPVGLGNVVAEYDETGNLVAHFTHGLGLASRVASGGASAYYNTDRVGSVVGMSGPAGTYVNRYAYLPFGERLNTSETVPNPFEYVGALGVMADASGLEYMRARFYDPGLGRFLAADPIRFASGDINLYRYVRNNPVEKSDPSGLAEFALTWLLSDAEVEAILFSQDLRIPTYTVDAVAEAIAAAEAEGAVALDLTGGGFLEVAGGTALEGAGGIALESAGGVALEAETVGLVVAEGGGGLLALGGQVLLLGVVGYTSYQGTRAVLEGSRFDAFVQNTFEGFLDRFFPPETVQVGPRITNHPIFSQDAFNRIAERRIQQITPFDPNDIGGPRGFGPERFIRGEEPLAYTVLFENQPTATAAAVSVVVAQPLDPDLDWSTFEVSDFGFGDLHIAVPPGLRSYSTRLDLTAMRGEYVDVQRTARRNGVVRQ